LIPYTKHIILALVSVCLLLSCNSTLKVVQDTNIPFQSSALAKNEIFVHNPQEFNTAIGRAEAGDRILLANGVWKDAELKFSAKGTSNAPIYIIAQEKGKVFFEGTSNIKMGGTYLHLEGLVFRNGYTPTSAVVSFQKDKQSPCNNCRVTECVIDDYNPPERFDTNYWIEIYGKNNRFDHNYLVAKRNRGVTLAVRLKNENDRENNHRIDHNYFGYRPILGSNGGETLRIGTSHYSLSNSNTIIENNYFEHCNGELEIISSKSCQNIFRNNTFHECQGTLTMRHGNETVVENNYFLGNRKVNTGGIRLINETQTVRNNYLEGLTGYRFKGALVIMNGVPNSPLNRYSQVIDSDMSYNLVIDCDHIQLCAGSDEERSATPWNTTFTNNIILNTEKDDVFTVYDDISGIEFKRNILSKNIKKPSFRGYIEESGFIQEDLEIPTGTKSLKSDSRTYGPIGSDEIPSSKNTGVDWYPKKDYTIRFGSGRTIHVSPGENTLFDAIKKAKEGDVLVLGAGDYHTTKPIALQKTISIFSPSERTKPTLTFERSPLFDLGNGGSLKMENLNISGKESDDYSGNSVVRTSRYSMINNYKLLLKSCDITDLDVNHSFNFLKVFKNTFADLIRLESCNFSNISGHVLNLDKETEDIGIYNAEDVVINNCTFIDIGGNAIKLYRGGRDESTFGPILLLKNSKFENVGHDKRNTNASAIHLHGVQHAELENLKIADSRKIHIHLIVGEPIIKLRDIELIKCEPLVSNSDAYSSTNLKVIND